MQVVKKIINQTTRQKMDRTNSSLETSSDDTSSNIKTLMTATYQPSFHHSIRTVMCGAIRVYCMEWAAAI